MEEGKDLLSVFECVRICYVREDKVEFGRGVIVWDVI